MHGAGPAVPVIADVHVHRVHMFVGMPDLCHKIRNLRCRQRAAVRIPQPHLQLLPTGCHNDLVMNLIVKFEHHAAMLGSIEMRGVLVVGGDDAGSGEQ